MVEESESLGDIRSGTRQTVGRTKTRVAVDHTAERFQYDGWCATCTRVMNHIAGRCLGCEPVGSEESLDVGSAEAVGAHTSKPPSPGRNGARPTGPRAMDQYVRHPNSWGVNR